MPCTIHLHGRLRKEFGPSFTLAVKTPAEAVRALCHLKPGIEQALRDGAWRVVRGPLKGGRRLGAEELHVNLDREMHILAAGRGAGGGRGMGAGKIILGVILIAAAVIFTGGAGAIGLAGAGGAGGAGAGAGAGAAAGAAGAAGASAGAIGLGGAAFNSTLMAAAGISGTNVALFGAAMVFGGISALLAPTPGAMTGGPQDTKPSYLFNGQVNMTDQGNPVPLVLGKIRVPGQVISLGIDTIDLSITSDPSIKSVTSGSSGEWGQ